MDDVQLILKDVFDIINNVAFLGKDAEKVADIRALLRQAFQKLNKNGDGADG